MTDSSVDATVAEIELRYEQAYSTANAPELAQIFAEDATVQTEWGSVLTGRAVIERGLVALFASAKGQGRLRNTPSVSRLADPNVIVSHGVTRREAPGQEEETFLYTRVYARRGREWVILANHIARPSIHPQPQGIGH
jgi:uncharacterized protein (TIGR02246 family)